MSTASASLAAPAALARPAAAATPGSVVSRRFDLAFFVLPPLGTLLFLALEALFPSAEAAFALSAVVWIALAQSHFGATLLFYLDPESRAHYRTRPGVYVAAPLLLVTGSLALGFTAWAPLALLAVPLFSFWHGNRQSVGVCGLYRGLTGSFDARSRRLESAAIFTASGAFTAAGVARLDLLRPLGLRLDPLPRPLLLAWALLVAAALVLLALALARARAQCRRAGVPVRYRAAVLVASWAMYAPYLVARDPLSAYLAALVPHYLQYHGLLWRVNRRKVDAGAVASGPLPALVASPLRYAGATVGFALLLGLVLAASRAAGRVEVGLAAVAGVNLAHFWLDGFFWRFRDPRARAATLRWIRA